MSSEHMKEQKRPSAAVRALLVESEETFRREMRGVPAVSMAYKVGVDHDLSYGQMALLALGPLLLERRNLLELAQLQPPARFTVSTTDVIR